MQTRKTKKWRTSMIQQLAANDTEGWGLFPRCHPIVFPLLGSHRDGTAAGTQAELRGPLYGGGRGVCQFSSRFSFLRIQAARVTVKVRSKQVRRLMALLQALCHILFIKSMVVLEFTKVNFCFAPTFGFLSLFFVFCGCVFCFMFIYCSSFSW